MKVAVCYAQITSTQTIVLMANGVFDSSGTTIWSPSVFYTLTDQIWFHPGNPPFVILRNMTWQVLWVKQELSTLPEHLSSHTVFVGYVLLDVLFLYFFSFGHCVSVLLRFTNSDYPLWYLQSLLSKYILSYSCFFFFFLAKKYS
jgi:hypothetical protein